MRLHNLDYLRGLAALSIMLYHYQFMSYGTNDAATLFSRIGVYGVSVFYVLSGLTLFTVYQNRFQTKDFVIKRVFRIYPLLVLVIALTSIAQRRLPDSVTLFLNATGLFGFLKPDAYIGMGMWSIGNELVFYAFFIAMVSLIRRGLFLWILFALANVYLFFAFAILTPSKPLEIQWGAYINPLNQVFLFAAGVGLGLYFQKVKLSNRVVLMLLIIAAAVFTLYPARYNTISLVTGWNRLVFSFVTILTCFCFYKLSYELPPILHRPLSLLGEASYSVYLLHPLVWVAMLKVPVSPVVRIAAGSLLTIAVAYGTYRLYEQPFIRTGKRLAK